MKLIYKNIQSLSQIPTFRLITLTSPPQLPDMDPEGGQEDESMYPESRLAGPDQNTGVGGKGTFARFGGEGTYAGFSLAMNSEERGAKPPASTPPSTQ